jgi:hypothetical protein
LPTGTYKVYVKGWKYGQTSKGASQVEWTLEVIDDGTEEHQAFVGSIVKEFHILYENTLWKLVNFFDACVGKENLKNTKFEVESSAFNKTLDYCKHRSLYVYNQPKEYNGKERNQFMGYLKDDNQPAFNPTVYEDDDAPAFLK